MRKSLQPLESSVTQSVIRSLRLLTQQNKNKVFIFIGAQLLISMLDSIGILLMGIVASLALSLTTSSQGPTFLSFFLEYLGLQNITDQRLLLLCAAAIVILLLVRTATSLFFSLKTYRFLARMGSEVSASLISKLFASPYWWIRSQSVNEISFALTQGVQYSIIGVLGQFIIFFSELCFLILMFTILFWVNSLMAIIALLLFVGFGSLVYFVVGRHVSSLSEKTTEKVVEGIQQIQNSLNLFREISLKSRESVFEHKFRNSQFESGTYFAKFNWIQLVPKFAIEIAVVLGAFFLALTSALTGGYISAVTDLSVFLVATSRIAPSALRLQQSLMSTRSYAGQSAKSFQYYDDLSNITSSLGDFNEMKLESQNRFGRNHIPIVKFSDVSYTFLDGKAPVLTDISFEIAPGEMVALVGPSGSGKSTLCDLIFGLLTPTSGAATIDGISASIFVKSNPDCVSYLPQETLIIPGTISENIAIGVDLSNVDFDELTQAIEKSQLTDFLNSIPDGLGQRLGDVGLKLSGGQKQRIGLARALYPAPKLLVLDEPTSSLDAETEDSFLRALKVMKGECSVLIIAHRLSTLKFTDKVIYLEAGRIVSSGNVDDLRRAIPRFDVQAGLHGL